MEQISFAYGGLHFIPERCFEPAGQHHSRIPLSRMGQKSANLFPSGFAYSHGEFCAASTAKDCDIFRCAESGRLYVPCEDGLRLYEEPLNRERGHEHGR